MKINGINTKQTTEALSQLSDYLTHNTILQFLLGL